MRHPFESINPSAQKKYFIFLFILTIAIMVIMNVIGAPLTTPDATSGIVSFELAFTPVRAQQIISSWSMDDQLRAAFIQGLDFLFPLVYSFALGLGCLMAANVLSSRGKPLKGLGVSLAWALGVAAICDYIENIALVAILFGRLHSPFPEIAGGCAVIKFSLILIAMVYILYGLVIRIMVRSTLESAT